MPTISASRTRLSSPDAEKRLTRDGAGWKIDSGNSSAITWRETPPILDRLIFELFSAQPDDPLSWAHHAIWNFRTEELLGHGGVEDASDIIPSDRRPEDLHPNGFAVTEMPYSAQPMLFGGGNPLGISRCIQGGTSLASSIPTMRTNEMEESLLRSQSFRNVRVSSQEEIVDFGTQAIELDEEKKLKASVAQILTFKKVRSGEEGSRSASLSDVRGVAFVDEDSEVTSDKQIRLGRDDLAFKAKESEDKGDENFERYFGKQHRTEGLYIRKKLESSASISNLVELTAPEKVPGRCILSPVGQVRITWDFVFFICLLFDVWATPMELVFFPESFVNNVNEGLPPWFRRITILVLSFFCCDIVMNFCTGVVQDGIIVMERRKIAMAYLQSWFWFDVLATLPEILIASFGSALFFVRVSRGMKTYKMLRALRILRAMRLISSQGFANMIMRHFELRSSVVFCMKMVQVNTLLLFLVHVHGSIWAALQPGAWKAQYPDEAYSKYYESLWTVFPSLTFGGEIPTSSGWQHLLAIILGMERVTFLILCAKWLLWRAFLQQMDAEHQCALEGALAYLKHHRVSPALQLKVFQNLHEIRNVQTRQHQFDKLSATSFPAQLKRLISDELWSEKLLSLDLIHHVASWQAEVVRELALLVREEVIASKVVVFSAGEPSSTAYLVVQGALAVTFHESESNTPDYLTGMWVGEKALVNPELRRIQTLVSKVWTQLMALDAADFQTIMVDFGLKEQFEELLRDQLWLGLCGRCGILGDHFSHDCPLLAEEPSRGLSSRLLMTNTTSGKSKLSRLRRLRKGKGNNKKEAADLHRFLSDHRLSRMKNTMNRYGVKCLNDLKLSTIEALRGDPEVQLSQSEWQVLSDVSIKEFRRKMKRVCTQVLAKSGDENNHLVFISHYKTEAGTEAALMQEDMQKIISGDQGNPGHTLKAAVFLDSEDLRDLNDLKHHVSRSHNVVLLLTPGVLSRPWCLVELVAAMKAGVRIVPVEVQRKDLTFTYPDEVYFKRLGSGTELDPGALKLIHREGIDNETLESAVRQVFMRIALPFSPHKTARVRQAELQDILKQCSFKADLGGRRLFRPSDNSNAEKSEDTDKSFMSTVHEADEENLLSEGTRS